MVFSFRGYLYNTDDCVLYRVITDEVHNQSRLVTVAKVYNSQVGMSVQMVVDTDIPLGILNRIKKIEKDRVNNFANIKSK